MNLKGKMICPLVLGDLFTGEDIELKVGDAIELRDMRELEPGRIACYVYANDGKHCLIFNKGLISKTTTIAL